MDYDKTIDKFKQGGSAKLDASHALIMSIYDYITYLAEKYHPHLFFNHMEDVINYCHLYLLDYIYMFNPAKGRFTTWSRWHILNALASFYGQYIHPVKTSRSVGLRHMLTISLGVYDRVGFDNKPIYVDLDLCKLKKLIITKYNQHDWDLWRDYCGFGSKPMSLSELSKKYGYNSKQAVHGHIVKVRNFLKDSDFVKELREK